MDWVISLAGLGVIVVAARDMFHTLWHPSGRGSLSRGISRAIWRLSRRPALRERGLAGPLAMLAVVTTWTVLVVLGWALVYAPHLPESFVYSSSLDPGRRGGPLDALYLSLVTAATLGFGDIVPRAGWLRLAAPVQAMIGFGLLTVAVSWVLQIYPALTRRRVLSLRLAMLGSAGAVRSLADLPAGTASGWLEGLAADIVQVRVDLTQYAATYYFRETEGAASLAATLHHAVGLAGAGRACEQGDVRLAAAVLTCALDDLARVLDEQFLRVGGSTGDILAAFAVDHGRGASGGG